MAYLIERPILRKVQPLLAGGLGPVTPAAGAMPRRPGVSCKAPLAGGRIHALPIWRRAGRGLGDVNSQATAALQAAGFVGATCAPQVESFPGGSWTINACQVPSMPAATFSADTVVAQTPAQLAAIYQQDLPQMNQSNQSLNQQLAALTGNRQAEALAAAPIGSPASTAIQYAGVAQPTPAATPSAGSATSSSSAGGYSIADLVAAFQSANSGTAAGASTSSSASSLLTGSVTIFGVSIPVWALGAGAIGLLFFFPRGR